MPINRRPKSPNELKQFRHLVITEIHRLYDCSSTGNIEILKNSDNSLDELTRKELLNVVENLRMESSCFEIDDRNYPEQKLKNPEKKYYNPDPPLYEDYIIIHPSEDKPVYLKIKPNFIDIHPQRTKPKMPSSLKPPANTHWEDITIKFIDGHNVDIKFKDKKRRSDYKEMGFEDKKRRLPNQQWDFLKLLAKSEGTLTWENSEANDSLKKKKQLLSQTLKVCFDIHEDPFLPYKQEKAYKIKITLIPE